MRHAMTPRLSDEEAAAFRRDGFVVPRYRLPPADLAKLQALTERLVADNPHLADVPMSCPHVPGSGIQELKSNEEWLPVSLNPDILDMIEQIIGPDIVLWGSNMFYKRPREGPATPWHRDGAYWPIRPLATTSVWIAISDSVRENGCLRFIPGSHAAREIGEHYEASAEGNVIPGTLTPDSFDESEAVDVEMEPGQVVIFDCYTIHGAQTNKGTRHRAGYALRFMPSTSHYDHEAALTAKRRSAGAGHDTRPLILARGIDRCGLNDFSRGHPQIASPSPA
jgi:ectoine hydroxylase-related dioxygenase (phytanoyl-CoA dioxygenase family)